MDEMNSIASDDHTGFDSYHECLQEYQEGIEVVQICIEPEDTSNKDEVSAFEDISNEELVENNCDDSHKINGFYTSKNKSEESLDQDLTLTEEDTFDLPMIALDNFTEIRSKSADYKIDERKIQSYEHCKDLNNSDEMVFAVTPTGLERISFDKYWKEQINEEVKNEIDTKDSDITTPTDTTSYYDATTKFEDNSLLYIDHDIDIYESCMEDDLNCKINIKINDKVNTIKTDNEITKTNKEKERRTSKNPKTKITQRKLTEYYNDQAETLEHIRKQRNESKNLENSDKSSKNNSNRDLNENKSHSSLYPGCHKCFLENYAYELSKYMVESSTCKYCEVVREILESPKRISGRSGSCPAIFDLVYDFATGTDDDGYLLVPVIQARRKSTGPLKFLVPNKKPSFSPAVSPKMTVSKSPEPKECANERWGPKRIVRLKRDGNSSLGLSIVGGKVNIIGSNPDEKKNIFGIFIKNVVYGTPAGNSGQLNTGDRILEVDGVSVRDSSHEKAVQLIKQSGDIVTLTVQSLLTWNEKLENEEVHTKPRSSPTPSVKQKAPSPPGSNSPQHPIKITVTSEPDEPAELEAVPSTDDGEVIKSSDVPNTQGTTYSSDEESSDGDEEDRRDLEGKTHTEQGVEIDRASAGALRRSKEEKSADPEQEDEFGYTSNKIRKKYANLGDTVLCVKLERTATVGLGLSLAGHRDRTRMAVFICGVNPNGSAAKSNPAIKVGDEILEINGIVLHGRCHLNASAIIKGLAGPLFKVILLRRKQALEDVAVKPITQFPVALEDQSLSEDRFAGYRGKRHVSIKKGVNNLGIMIIEGRHNEVGQGIFVSDIQENSPAEQAGLQIGDMILAVNNDSILGSSYEAAANILKKTEGIVILTVCNPNKKDDSDNISTTSKLSNKTPSKQPTPDASIKLISRPQTPASKPAASPVKSPEAIVDPSTSPILANTETFIEIDSNNKNLGIVLLGGSDTLLNGAAAVILEVYPEGIAGKDGRLKPGDQIVECNGVKITKEMTHERICSTIKRTLPKIKMTVYRPEPIKYEEVEIDLVRKPGKGLGLALMAKKPPPGVYISDILPGGSADIDGRIQRGDQLMTIEGTDVTNAAQDTVAAVIKSVTGKATIKVRRFKIFR